MSEEEIHKGKLRCMVEALRFMSVHGANQEEMEKLEPQTLLDVTAGLMLIAQASMHVLAEEEETTYEDTLEFMLTSAEFEYSMSLVEEPPLSSD